MNIKMLKDKILQLAIEGKLVEQNPNDEPASVLLERIKAEKERLIREKKIKKEKPLPEISEEEKSFEIPDSWIFCRFTDVIDVRDGTHDTPKYVEEEKYPLITGKDFMNGKLNFQKTKYISKDDYEKIIERSKVEKDDIIYSMIGGNIGSMVLINDITEIAIKNVALFKKYCQDSFISKYLLYFLEARKQIMKNSARGGAQPFLSLAMLRNEIFALPPLEEQKRIVAKVEELFKIIDELDSNKENLLQAIENTKNKVLQLAIQGKLVEQNPYDESVSVLLEKIRAEKEQLIKEKKIKKEKPLSEISEEEKLFEIPNSWEWVKFGELVRYNIGKTPPRKDKVYWDNAYYHWVSISDMISDGKIKETKEKINENSFKNIFKGNISPRGTLLMSFKLTVGRVSILDIDAFHNEAIISIYPFSDNNDIVKKYLFKVLPVLSQFGKTKGAIKGNTLNSNSINNLIIPIPPIEEQKRIVAKVDEIMKCLDSIRGIINIVDSIDKTIQVKSIEVEDKKELINN